MMARTSNDTWWKHAVFYQIYPLSFADSDADSFGDLRGIISRLGYLSDTLGIDALWLSPFYKSPMKDWGYDVSDHTDVDPIFGGLHDARELIDVAHSKGLKVVVDYVINHTSDEHPWFIESKSSRDNPKRDWYVWRDGDDGEPPTNWVSVFSGPAWSYDDTTDQWYRHTYLREHLRRRFICPSMALFKTPINALTMKMPPSVTNNITMRNSLPVSAPMVPGSRVRIRLSQAASPKGRGVGSFDCVKSKMEMMTPAMVTMASDITNNMPIMAGVPWDIRLSN
jgi:hypothetical protein